jgi:cytoskeletal protein CcmA (bactofilin family)
MFSRDNKTPTATPEYNAPVTRLDPVQRSNGNGSTAFSVIGPDLKIKGDLICNGDIQIDGEVEGDVQGNTLTIGEGANVKGTLSGNNVRVCGSFNGQLKGKSVALAKTAKLVGDVTHQTLAVEAGAQFEGNSKRINGATS